MSTLQIIGFIIPIVFLLMLSAFYSFSEMAIASSSEFRLKVLRDKEKNKFKKKKISKIIHLIQNYNETITSIVVFNNIVNVLSATLATTFFTLLLGGGWAIGLSFGIMTILIIIFGELVPKMLAKKYPEVGLIKFTIPLYITRYTVLPISALLKKIVKQENGSIVSSDAELKEIIKDADHISTYEEKLLSQSLNLDETKVSKVMTPIDKTISVTTKVTKEKLMKLIELYKFTRIPIIERGTSKGVINTKSLLIDISINKRKNFDLSNYSLDIPKFNNNEVLSNIFNQLRINRQHIGLVIDKKNKILGIITIEDIVETLVGEMYDENDVKQDGIFKLANNSYLVEPSVKVKKFFKENISGIKTPEVSSQTTFRSWIKSEEFKSFEKLEHIIYANMIIWIKKDKIQKDKDIFEIDII